MDIHVRQSSSFYQTLVDIPAAGAVFAHPRRTGNAQCRRPDGRGCARQIRSDRIRCHIWHTLSNYYDNLVTPLVLAENRPLALMMRPGDVKLKAKVDEYLLAHHFTRHRQQTFTDDLSGLKKRRRLRMITRNNAMTYFIHRGRPGGVRIRVDEKVRRAARLAPRNRHSGQPRRTVSRI